MDNNFVIEEIRCEQGDAVCIFSLLKTGRVTGMYKQGSEEFFVSIESWKKAQELFNKQLELGWSKMWPVIKMNVKTVLLEFIGTFLLVLLILIALSTTRKFTAPLFISLGIFFIILFILWMGGAGHINPAVSTAFYSKGDLSLSTFSTFIIAQILGAILAVWVFNLGKKSSVE